MERIAGSNDAYPDIRGDATPTGFNGRWAAGGITPLQTIPAATIDTHEVIPGSASERLADHDTKPRITAGIARHGDSALDLSVPAESLIGVVHMIRAATETAGT